MGQEPIGIIGAGLMGHGIAQVFATAGHPVTVVDADPAALRTARAKIARNLDLLVEYEVLGRAAADRVPAQIQFDADPAALGTTALLIEAVAEDLEVKRTLFRRLQPLLAAHTIIATNTSSIPVGLMAESTGRPDRFTTSHFFRPAYIIPIVEVTKGELTSEVTVQTVVRLLKGAGLRPVRINVDLPGQVANRLRHA
ncbi:MAG: NAD(P)-binding domain-containing protein, partial [Actinobacteria bacterium]|nr:NAD(P)-binding domain-containing protein [Actinomycetota bacterium]